MDLRNKYPAYNSKRIEEVLMKIITRLWETWTVMAGVEDEGSPTHVAFNRIAAGYEGIMVNHGYQLGDNGRWSRNADFKRANGPYPEPPPRSELESVEEHPPAPQLREIGYTAPQLKMAEYSSAELEGIGYTAEELAAPASY